MNNYDVEVQWLINDICNFRCVYCWLQKEPAIGRSRGIQDTARVIEGFNNKGITWLIHMTGGEPFLFPNFLELCQGLTKKHYITVTTNLTHPGIRPFAATVNPERVDFVHVSMHIAQRKWPDEIKHFIEHYHVLKKAGFRIFTSYVMYANLFRRFRKNYKFFKSQGIIIHPKVFRGNCSHFPQLPLIGNTALLNKLVKRFERTYPSAYTAGQKQFIRDWVDQSFMDEELMNGKKISSQQITIDLAMDKLLVDGQMSFKGKRCAAGRKFLKMEKDGEAYRCNDEAQYYIGNMFKGQINLLEEDLVCSSEKCSCPYVGIRYASPEEAEALKKRFSLQNRNL